jgi:hypothetical protein
MPRHRLFRCLLAIALMAVTASVCAAEVTIYRCTDAKGRLTLRDTPCRKGEHQQTRAMVRPADPPPRPATKVRPAPAAPASDYPTYSAPPRMVVVTPPRPMYECVNPDGDIYTSESGEGNPRWVPLWTLGYPVWGHRAGIDTSRMHTRTGVHVGTGNRGGSHGGMRMPRPPDDGPGPPSRPILGQVYPAGTWVRDECFPLPVEEVCDRLRDRRYELDRRYNSALQSERESISIEQRGIDARLSNDCGVY